MTHTALQKTIEMEKTKGRMSATSALGRFKERFLRLYRAELTVQNSLVAHKASFTDSYHGSRMEVRRALLKAESSRAMALMQRQKHQRLY